MNPVNGGLSFEMTAYHESSPETEAFFKQMVEEQNRKSFLLKLPSLNECEVKQRDYGDDALNPIEAALLRLHPLTSPGVGLYTGTDLRKDLQAIIYYVAENSKAE